MIFHDIDAYRAFTESLHPRGTGALGGQFVAAGSSSSAAVKKTAPPAKKAAAGKRPAPARGASMSFDGRRGTGYGIKGGDKRVRSLQQALNKLGLSDSSGKKLVVDGKLGPKTTAAIRKAQRKLGLKADGVVTPALLRQLTTAKKLEKVKPAKKAAPRKVTPAKKAAAPAPRPARRRGSGYKAAPVTIARRSVSYNGSVKIYDRRHNPISGVKALALVEET